MKEIGNTLKSTIEKCGENSSFTVKTDTFCTSLTEEQKGIKLLRRSLIPN